MRTTFPIAAAASIVALLTCAGQAQAQATRVFISGHGSDSNPCSLAAPCRTFQQAHDTVAAGGEIAVLDTAGYGALTITKSVSIVNPGGVEAGIAVPLGGTGILITGGSVALRGLTLEGANLGQDGVKFAGGSRLEIVDCVIRDFTHDGIYINHSSGAMTLSISNTIASDNGNVRIDIGPAPGDGTASVSGNVYQSLTNNNAGAGIVVFGLNGPKSLLLAVSGGVSDNNGVGVSVTGPNPTLQNGLSVQLNDVTISNNKGNGIHNSLGPTTILSHVKLFGNDLAGAGGVFDIDNEGAMDIFNNTMVSRDILNNGGILSDGTNNIRGGVGPITLERLTPG